MNAWEARARVEITSWITCSIAHCVCAAATVLGMMLSLRPCTHLDVLPMNVFRQVPNASERIRHKFFYALLLAIYEPSGSARARATLPRTIPARHSAPPDENPDVEMLTRAMRA